jgi:hypothetical protein
LRFFGLFFFFALNGLPFSAFFVLFFRGLCVLRLIIVALLFISVKPMQGLDYCQKCCSCRSGVKWFSVGLPSSFLLEYILFADFSIFAQFGSNFFLVESIFKISYQKNYSILVNSIFSVHHLS